MGEPGSGAPSRHPPLAAVLLVVNLAVLLLPVGGLFGLQLYQNALLRQTEGELVAQAAFVVAAAQDAWARTLPGAPAEALPPPEEEEPALDPRPPRLNALVDRVWPPAEAARPAPHDADPTALTIGAGLSPLLQGTGRMTLAGIRVVDRTGIVVASTAGDLGLSIAHRTEVRRALEGQDVRLLRARVSDEPRPPMDSLSRGTPVRVFVALPIELEGEILGAVVLSRTPLALSKALYQSRFALLFGAVGLLLAVAGVTALTTFTLARPLRALVDQSRAIARGDATPGAIPNPGTRELAELSAALTHMAEALAQRADYIQAFAQSVSHEFKTPLASMRGTVELLEDHLDGMGAEERARFLGMLGADVGRLERLVKALLELARADMARPGGRCDAAASCRSAAARAQARGMDVAVDLPPGEAPAGIAAEALDGILTNLLDNARRHGQGAARISLTLRRQDGSPGGITIEVADDGPGVSAANREKIFEPFFTTARDAGGTGLGLSVSRSLARAHGGDLALVEGAGATFRLSLPA